MDNYWGNSFLFFYYKKFKTMVLKEPEPGFYQNLVFTLVNKPKWLLNLKSSQYLQGREPPEDRWDHPKNPSEGFLF